MSSTKSPPNSLPVLESIRIASPCRADWNSMTGDDRVRFCGECSKQVFDLSAMNREEAQQFLADQTGRTCVRLFRREDGTVLTADCPVGLARVRQKLRRMFVAGLAMVGTLLFGTLSAIGWSMGKANAANGVQPDGVFTRWLSNHQRMQQAMGNVGSQPVMGKMQVLMGDVCIPAPPVLTLEPLTSEPLTPDGGSQQSIEETQQPAP